MLVFVSYLRRERVRNGKSLKQELKRGFKITCTNGKRLLKTIIGLKLVQIRVETIPITHTTF